jgi:hypothetical protein
METISAYQPYNQYHTEHYGGTEDNGPDDWPLSDSDDEEMGDSYGPYEECPNPEEEPLENYQWLCDNCYRHNAAWGIPEDSATIRPQIRRTSPQVSSGTLYPRRPMVAPVILGTRTATDRATGDRGSTARNGTSQTAENPSTQAGRCHQGRIPRKTTLRPERGLSSQPPQRTKRKTSSRMISHSNRSGCPELCLDTVAESPRNRGRLQPSGSIQYLDDLPALMQQARIAYAENIILCPSCYNTTSFARRTTRTSELLTPIQ